MRKMNKMKVLQLLSRVWNGPNGVLAGKQSEQKMITILRNKFPKAKLIEVNDVSGKTITPAFKRYEKLRSIYFYTISLQ